MYLYLNRFVSASVAILLTALYVASIFVFPWGRSKPHTARGICERFISNMCVSIGTICLLGNCMKTHLSDELLWGSTAKGDTQPGASVLDWIGLSSRSNPLSATAFTLVCMLTLHIGPIAHWHMVITTTREDSRRPSPLTEVWELIRSQGAHLGPLLCLRCVVLAPLSEELFFRGIVHWVLLGGGYSITLTTLLSTALFISAHFHTLLLFTESNVNTTQELIIVAVGICITTGLFGCISSVLLVKTGHLIAPWLAHVIFNFTQGPDISWMLPDHHLFHRRYSIGGLYLLGILLTVGLMGQSNTLVHSHYPSLQQVIRGN